MRKTFNYYKEMLNGGNSKIMEVMSELIKKYGEDNSIRLDCEFNWNHRIEGFGICQYGKNKGKVYVDIYWQGDSTDGNASEWLSDMLYSYGDYVIPADYSDGYERHGRLRIDREEMNNAIKSLITYITPKEVKKRKEDKRVRNVLSAIINEKRLEYRENGVSWFGNEKYCNAENAVCKFVDNDIEKLHKKTDNEVKAILEVIWSNNHKDNYLIKEDYYGRKLYDFSCVA